MIYGFLVNMENIIETYSYSTPWAVHRFDATDMAVPGLYISWLDLWIIIFHEENENFSDKIENIQKAESEEYSNPTSKLCSKLPECVNVLILQNLDIPGLPDYQILLCRILEKSDY